jgi:hypothetical protein
MDLCNQNIEEWQIFIVVRIVHMLNEFISRTDDF